MRHYLKFAPALLLGSVLGGCSMAGTGDYFADEYAAKQAQQMPYKYGGQNCGYTGCESAYPVAQPHVQSHNYGQPQYAQHGPRHTPDAHAYGQSVQGHGQAGYGVPAYAAPTYGAPHGLRGPRKQPYIYGNLGAINYEAGDDLFGVVGRAGYQTKSIFGAEVEGTLGVTDEDTRLTIGTDTFDTSLKVKNSIAGFAVARVPVSRKFNLLGRLGYHNTELGADLTDALGVTTNADFSTDGIAYGIGVEYAFNPKTSVRLDSTVYDYDGPDADSVSLAIARKF